jgi:hypothetical protein
MYEYTENILINLSSEFGIKKNDSKNSILNFDFPSIIDSNNEDISRVYISLSSAMLPVSFYNITSKNNIFDYGYYVESEFINNYNFMFNRVELEEGNYNSLSLINSINNGLIQNNDGFLNVKYNKITGKVQFTNDDINVKKIVILITSTLNYVLGFKNIQYATVMNSPNQFLIGDYPLNLIGVKNLNISSNAFNILSFSSYKSSSTHILASINVDVPNGSIISFRNNNAENKFILKNKELSFIDINIKDESHSYINFNNVDWTITLNLQVVKIIRFIEPSLKTNFNNILDKSNKRVHDLNLLNGQYDINDLKNVNDDFFNNDLDVLVYELENKQEQNAKKTI